MVLRGTEHYYVHTMQASRAIWGKEGGVLSIEKAGHAGWHQAHIFIYFVWHRHAVAPYSFTETVSKLIFPPLSRVCVCVWVGGGGGAEGGTDGGSSRRGR